MSDKVPADPSSSSPGRLRPAIVEAKQSLAESREKIRASHHRGLDAIQVCARLTTSVDGAIQSLWRAALEDFDPLEATALSKACVLVAHGGYGRRQLAPHSDVDLMVLYEPSVAPLAERLAVRLTQDIFDVGLDLGHSLRTVANALDMAKKDLAISLGRRCSSSVSLPLIERLNSGEFRPRQYSLLRQGVPSATSTVRPSICSNRTSSDHVVGCAICICSVGFGSFKRESVIWTG